MSRTILLLGTLDTKGEELRYVRDLIVRRGHTALVVDAGILGDAASLTPDIPAEEIARAGGSTLAELRARRDRGTAVTVMLEGLRALVPVLYAQRRFHGVLGLGGGGGTALATAAMRELPVGVPKLMVSTMASGDTAPYVGVRDITMMYSVVDVAGLNPLSRRILANAAGGICGMVEQEVPGAADRPLIAATMFGVTTPCVNAVRQRLHGAGFDVVVFHATGSGGRAMEGLIADGWFAGVADVTTTEWCDEVVGGILSAGPERLSAAGRAGIPQVVSVGATDMVNFGPAETVPAAFRERRLYRHNPQVTLMRTTPEEAREIGRRIAARLNAARGPTVMVLPLRGVSMLDAEGQPFHDPVADQALFDALRADLRPPVELVEVDAHVNDPAFAAVIAERLLTLLDRTGSPARAGAAGQPG
ncbi:MAG: Tm-1-like ATP-binding domain-containing protein [Gemmatimonadales bacterium]